MQHADGTTNVVQVHPPQRKCEKQSPHHVSEKGGEHGAAGEKIDLAVYGNNLGLSGSLSDVKSRRDIGSQHDTHWDNCALVNQKAKKINTEQPSLRNMSAYSMK
jgi:hypothetical protein